MDVVPELETEPVTVPDMVMVSDVVADASNDKLIVLEREVAPPRSRVRVFVGVRVSDSVTDMVPSEEAVTLALVFLDSLVVKLVDMLGVSEADSDSSFVGVSDAVISCVGDRLTVEDFVNDVVVVEDFDRESVTTDEMENDEVPVSLVDSDALNVAVRERLAVSSIEIVAVTEAEISDVSVRVYVALGVRVGVSDADEETVLVDVTSELSLVECVSLKDSVVEGVLVSVAVLDTVPVTVVVTVLVSVEVFSSERVGVSLKDTEFERDCTLVTDSDRVWSFVTVRELEKVFVRRVGVSDALNVTDWEKESVSVTALVHVFDAVTSALIVMVLDSERLAVNDTLFVNEYSSVEVSDVLTVGEIVLVALYVGVCVKDSVGSAEMDAEVVSENVRDNVWVAVPESVRLASLEIDVLGVRERLSEGMGDTERDCEGVLDSVLESVGVSLSVSVAVTVNVEVGCSDSDVETDAEASDVGVSVVVVDSVRDTSTERVTDIDFVLVSDDDGDSVAVRICVQESVSVGLTLTVSDRCENAR